MPIRKFLWLTDVHYSAKANKVGLVASKVDQAVFKPLVTFITKLSRTDHGLAFVGVGGDLTDRGEESGLDQFHEEMLPALLKLAVGQTRAVCIVPGNHDVDWGLDEADAGYYVKKFAGFRKIVDNPNPKDPTIEVTTCFFPSVEDGEVIFEESPRAPIYLNRNESQETLVLNINSAIRCGELDSQYEKAVNEVSKTPISYPKPDGTPKELEPLYRNLIKDVAHVTEEQLLQLGAALEREKQALGTKWDQFFRVALIHHHLLPYIDQLPDDRQFQHMVDPNRVLKLLDEFEFHVALSGHTHAIYDYNYMLPSGREIILIGGFTLGGQPSDSQARGIRHITVDSNRYRHRCEIRDIRVQDCTGAVEKVLINAPMHSRVLTIPVSSILDGEERAAGRWSQEVVSTTRIGPDGDAFRSVDFQGYVVKAEGSPFLSTREITLPSTSGEIDPDIRVNRTDPEGRRSSERFRRDRNANSLEISFDPPLRGDPDKSSFDVKWIAKNAFALDGLQFRMKYPEGVAHPGEEFAFFTPDLPIRRLDLVVQFPSTFEFESRPRISVVEVDPNTNDTRLWLEDLPETKHLEKTRVFRSVPALNQYSISVEAPRMDRSYRISWKLRPSVIHESSIQEIEPVLKFLDQIVDDKGRVQQQFLEVFSERVDAMVTLTKESRFCDQDKIAKSKMQLDSSIMIWDLARFPRKLSQLAAMQTTNDGTPVPIFYDPELTYGRGIAGRTLKSNQIEIWEKTYESHNSPDPVPNFYVEVKGAPRHENLICIPFHIPVSDDTFFGNLFANVYKRRAPIGVFTVGGGRGMLSGIRPQTLDRHEETLLGQNTKVLQHEINKQFGILLEACGYKHAT